MADRVSLPEFIGTSGVIAPLPAADRDSLYAACEIMIQEGVCAWTVPASATDIVRALWEMFDQRAVVGVRDVSIPLTLPMYAHRGRRLCAGLSLVQT